MSFTEGPWRWEINQQSKGLHLVGGRPRFDLTIMDFVRWGTHGAAPRLREPGQPGMNLMHRVCDRSDWIKPFAGREHHARWCSGIVHPDMVLIEAAPDLFKALLPFVEHNSSEEFITIKVRTADVTRAREALSKAIGDTK